MSPEAVGSRSAIRRSLQERRDHLRDVRIPELEESWRVNRDDESLLLLRRALEELEHLEAALGTLGDGAGPGAASSGIAPGDLVVVREQDGRVSTYLLVDGDLGRLDRSWLTTDSPLGLALLGRSPGDSVVVTAPGGTFTFEVLDVLRPSGP